jgi:predicted RNase H-like HicB family nuclease
VSGDVIFRRNGAIGFSAYWSQAVFGIKEPLPGCIATGATLSETEAAIREAIVFHLDGLREDGSPIPPPSSKVEYIEVAA